VETVSITYTEGVSVALVIQHAKRMRSIVLSSVSYLALRNFSTLPHKRHDFPKRVVEHKTRVLMFSKTLSETFFLLKRIWRDAIIIAHRLHAKYPLLFSDFNESVIFSADFRAILKYQI
jgi:hypothetical protein